MSLVFNDTTYHRGIVQTYERECGYSFGDVSGNITLLKQFTADANLAFDEMLALIFRADGKWQYDDSNNTDYPIITGNLIAGQRDYSILSDQDGNLILEIFAVYCASPSGVFVKLASVDVETDDAVSGTGNASGVLFAGSTDSFTNGANVQGTPTRYDKLANSVFLDPIPNYNAAGGLKIYVNREPNYFTYTDTTKKPGVPGLLHRYFAIRPAEDYARRNTLASYAGIRAERLQLEMDIKEYFAARNQDDKPRFSVLTNTGRDSNR